MLKKKEKVEKQKEQNQETENKIGIKEKIKRFLKNKKAVAMLMEYIITIECFAMLFLLIAPEEVKAASISQADENGITWAYTLSNGQATNVYYESGTLGETVTIPATISDGTNEYPVVSLCNNSGSDRNIFTKTNGGENTTVKEVIIPETVTIIGDNAFNLCKSLAKVNIPSGVTTLGTRAFRWCIPLTEINLPEGLTKLGYASCVGTSIETIKIPDNITKIEDYTFASCEKLKHVEWSKNLAVIGSYSFFDSGLEEVYIPEGVTSIGYLVFLGCSKMTSLTVDDNNINYSSENDILYNKDKTILIQGAGGKTGELIIPSSVKSIEKHALRACDNLTSVQIPEGVTSIGWYSFSECNSLTSVNIPSTVTSISAGTFARCGSLTNVNIAEGVNTIREYAFQECSSLASINIPSTVNNMGFQTFARCSNLVSVNIPNGVTEIGKSTFYGCTSLASIDIPDSVTSIREYAFQNCSSLTNLVIPDSVTSIKKYAISKCTNLKEVKLSNNLSELEENVLWLNTSLISVEIPSSVARIGQGVFSECSSLTSVEIPDSVTSIGSYAFDWCSSLTRVEIPDSVTSIGSYAFRDCSSLTSVEIPSGVTSIGGSAFRECSSLANVTIPEGVTTVEKWTFKNCTSLTKVNLLGNVDSIATEAFYNCIKLSDIYINNAEENITFEADWKINCNAYVHYEDCKHQLNYELSKDNFKIVGIINGIEEELPTGYQISCGDNYEFKIVDENGETVESEPVMIISGGEFTNSLQEMSYIEPNEEGIFNLEKITRNKTIQVGLKNGYKGFYTDEKGITWGYIYEDETATQVYYIKGDIEGILEIPEKMGEYETKSIGDNILDKANEVGKLRLPKGITSIDYSILNKYEDLEEVYLNRTKEELEEENLESIEKMQIHYADCKHQIKITSIEGITITPEELEQEIECESTYEFSIDIQDENIKGVVVTIKDEGSDTEELLTKNSEGKYRVENISKNKEINIIKGCSVVVKHIDKEGNQLQKDELFIGKEGESYSVQRKEIANYRSYGEDPSNAAGNFTQEDIIVTYVYEKIPSGIITIKYVDENGEDIIDSEVNQGYVGEEYKITRKNIKGYKDTDEQIGTITGIYTEENVELIFHYEKIKEGTIVIKYVDRENNLIKSSKAIEDNQKEYNKIRPEEIDGYKNIDKEEEGKEITYTYEKADKTGQANKWTTEKTLIAIAGAIAILIVMFIIIAKREKEVEVNGKKYRTIEEAIEAIKENKQEEKVEIKVLKDIERDEKIEGLDDETINIDCNGYEIKINEQENKDD